MNSPMNTQVISIERPTTNSRLFVHTRWDAVPAAAGLFHLTYFLGLFFLYPHAPLWVMLILGFIYSLMVNANINGVGHNFIHNPFFRSKLPNRLFGITQSIACCFSQTMYDAVHMQHHKGNSDRQDENGDTVDWLSIYRHGHDGEPEGPEEKEERLPPKIWRFEEAGWRPPNKRTTRAGFFRPCSPKTRGRKGGEGGGY